MENNENNEENEEKFELHTFTADPGQNALRIDKFLTDRIENASRNKVQNALKSGFVTVNGNVIRSNYKIKPDDKVVVFSDYEPREIELIAEEMPLDIVYEDDTLLVVNKGPEMVVHPSYGHYTGTLVNGLMYHLKDLPLFSTGEARPGLVHRIDKNTSGLLVIAKTEAALTHLSKQFYDRTTDRLYTAMVWGCPKEEAGTIDVHVGRNPKNRKIMHPFPDGDQGKHAVTHYKILEKLGYVTLIECKLETGRTHQIRVHLKYLGHPLFNDADYGGDVILKGTRFTKYKQYVQNCFKILPRQALHARTLAFDHPVTGKRMTFDSELPEDFAMAIEKWQNYIENREI